MKRGAHLRLKTRGEGGLVRVELTGNATLIDVVLGRHVLKGVLVLAVCRVRAETAVEGCKVHRVLTVEGRLVQHYVGRGGLGSMKGTGVLVVATGAIEDGSLLGVEIVGGHALLNKGFGRIGWKGVGDRDHRVSNDWDGSKSELAGRRAGKIEDAAGWSR